MAHDSSNNRIYIDTSTTPNKGVCIADLQTVLRSSRNALGGIITTANINKMAKYKPVCLSKKGLLTESDRASVRYGFGAGNIPSLDMRQTYPSNDWSYDIPRGMAYDEWFRIRDFEGYYRLACAPLAIMVGRLVYDGESQILFFGDGYSNSIREDGLYWQPNESLSIMELLHSGSTTYDGQYIAFLLVNKTDSGHAKNLIVTKKTISDFVSGGFSQYILKIYAQGTQTDPPVPILSQQNDGDTIEVIACLMTGNYPTTGEYAVYTPENTPTFLSLVPYSLGFVSGCDRAEAVIGSGAFMMDGTEITGWNVIATDTFMEETDGVLVYRAYSLEIRATLSTVEAESYTGTMNISGMMTFTGNGRYGRTLNDSGDLPPQGVAAKELTSDTSGQDRGLWSSGGVNYIWVPKVNGVVQPANVTLSVDFDYPFRAGHHATDTFNTNIPN